MSDRDDFKPWLRGPAVVRGALLAVALSALAPAAAWADEPRITRDPVVAGTPQVGQTLRAEGADWTRKGQSTASWQWIRCDGMALDVASCDAIGGATATSYTATSADRGKRLRVMLTVRDIEDPDASDSATSGASGVVAAAPVPTATPTPTPITTPEPEPAPDPVPPAQAAAPLQPAVPIPQGAVLPAAAAKPPTAMRPAPLVRIRGRLSRTGARISLLTVRAPKGARIAVRCLGRGCPARRWARATLLTRVARFERGLPAGTRLIVTVTKAGRIGKHTTIVIRRGKAPTRLDRCLVPGSRKPVRCAEAAT